MKLLSVCALAALAVTNIGCHDTSGNITTQDDCSGSIQTVSSQKVIYPNQQDAYLLQTPRAAGDCTTLYQFSFRWADPTQRAGGSPNIDIAFNPPPPKGYDATPQEGVDGWWRVSFAPTPSATTGNTTVFRIQSYVVQPALPSDSVEIQASIRYLIAPN